MIWFRDPKRWRIITLDFILEIKEEVLSSGFKLIYGYEALEESKEAKDHKKSNDKDDPTPALKK